MHLALQNMARVMTLHSKPHAVNLKLESLITRSVFAPYQAHMHGVNPLT